MTEKTVKTKETEQGFTKSQLARHYNMDETSDFITTLCARLHEHQQHEATALTHKFVRWFGIHMSTRSGMYISGCAMCGRARASWRALGFV
jgi:hypothetical protein